jgi:hypothetical protein
LEPLALEANSSHANLDLPLGALSPGQTSAHIRLGKQTVYIQFARNRCAIVGTADVIASRAHVDLSISDGRNGELDGIARGVSAALGAVPQFCADVVGIISVQDNGTTTRRLGRAVFAVVERPENPIRIDWRR